MTDESLFRTHRHLISVKGLLLRECVKTFIERHVTSPGGNPQAEVPERLERDGLVTAVSTPEGGLELTDKQINQMGVIASYVTFPRLHGLLTYAGIIIRLILTFNISDFVTSENYLFQCQLGEV